MTGPDNHDEFSGSSMRCRRVAEAIKEVVGQVIVNELSDPRLGFLTVTRVKVTPDLKQAKVFVSILGENADRAKSLGALRHAAGFVKRKVGDRLDLRYTPGIIFEFDDGVDKSIRVSRLLYNNSSVDKDIEPLPPLDD